MRSTEVRVKTETLRQRVTTYTCERCGKKIDPEADEPDFCNTLEVFLNDGYCVSQRFRLDLCTTCLELLWPNVCRAIGRDPDDISGSDFDDD